MNDTTVEAAPGAVTDTFEAFFEREYPSLVRLAYLNSGDAAEAEEKALAPDGCDPRYGRRRGRDSTS